MTHEIPPITHPLGRHWEQPPREAIEVDNTHALMTAETLEALHEYSTTIPSGVYPGKMWRAQLGGVWFLRWFGIVPGRDDLCSRNEREVLLA